MTTWPETLTARLLEFVADQPCTKPERNGYRCGWTHDGSPMRFGSWTPCLSCEARAALAEREAEQHA